MQLKSSRGFAVIVIVPVAAVPVTCVLTGMYVFVVANKPSTPVSKIKAFRFVSLIIGAPNPVTLRGKSPLPLLASFNLVTLESG